MRSKEASNDYRYFPEPDLLPLEFGDELIDEARTALPELPDEKRLRYTAQLALSDYDASALTADPDIADYFEATLAVCPEGKLAANWVMGEVAAAVNRSENGFAAAHVRPQQLGTLLLRIGDGTISGKMAKDLFEQLWRASDPSRTIDELIDEQGPGVFAHE